jgi:hypothetical protein
MQRDMIISNLYGVWRNRAEREHAAADEGFDVIFTRCAKCSELLKSEINLFLECCSSQDLMRGA